MTVLSKQISQLEWLELRPKWVAYVSSYDNVTERSPRVLKSLKLSLTMVKPVCLTTFNTGPTVCWFTSVVLKSEDESKSSLLSLN